MSGSLLLLFMHMECKSEVDSQGKNTWPGKIKHNSVVSERNYPTLLPYYSSPIPMSMQSLKKIVEKVLKLEHGNEAQSIFDIHQEP